MATTDTISELDELQEIIGDFLIEADELIDSLDNNFVKLESTPSDPELLNEIFRAIHTIKGTSSFLGLEQITELSHKMEDILNKLRKSEMVATPDIMDLLLEGVDQLKILLGFVRDKSDEQLDLSVILAKLIATFEGGDVGSTAASTEESSASDESENADTDSEQPVAEKSSNTPSAGSGPVKKTVADQTIRVDVDRLDALMNMMGELVLGRNAVAQAVNKMAREHEGDATVEAVNQATTGVSFITTELQMAVMKMRMQPVGKVFNKFPRLVRDLARDANKQIELQIVGEGTELDKSVIEEIGDPLVHIIRNSCDHGLETPEEREQAGKNKTGVVKLEAFQEGSHIVIRVTDDGRGLDVDRIRDKAVENGLTTREDVDSMPDRDVFRYIFEAGLSTAKKVTGVSGRGVGMDVVRTNIEKLNGLIELDSAKGKGTTITIKLPLTLAIIQGLPIEADDEVYILPLSSVCETVHSNQADVYYLNRKPVCRLRDEIIPLINLPNILHEQPDGFVMSEKPYIVIIGLADRKLGIMVDKFLGQEEVVIKSMGEYLGSTMGIAGATILGDGRIRLIVDLMGLFKIAAQQA